MAMATRGDGRVIKFPDGLPPDQVKMIIEKAKTNPPVMQPAANAAPATAPAATPKRPAPGKIHLQIGDHTVEVDNSFLQMSPADQQATVDEIEQSITGGKMQSDNYAAPLTPAPVADQSTKADPPMTQGQRTTRDLQIGTQGVGRAFADIAGAPGDLGNLIVNGMAGAINVGGGLAADAANAIGDHLGHDPQIPHPELPRTRPFGGSDEWADLASWATEKLGGNVIQPEDMSRGEKLAYTVDRFGTGAGVPGALMARAATGMKAAEAPALLRAYTGPNAGRTVIGDFAGGVGSGVANDALDNYAPDYIAQSPIARFLATIAGGMSGSSLASLVSAPKKAVETAAGYLPAREPALKDPETGLRPDNRHVDQAARHMQNAASDPFKAANSIAANQRYFADAGGAMPSTGLMSDDAGLQMFEKAQRRADPRPFAERDRAVRTSAFDDLAALFPAGADSEVPRTVARQQVGARRAEADAAVKSAKANAAQADDAERELMQGLQPFAGGASVASEDLDKLLVDQTLRPMQKQKNDLYAAVDPNGDVMRSTEPLTRLAGDLRDAAKGLPPSVQQQVLPEALLRDIEATAPGTETGTGQMSFKDLNDTRSVVSSMENQARNAGQFPLADTLSRIKGAINADGRQLAADGSEAGNRAMAADKYFEDAFAPLFARGEGGRLRKDINRDDSYRSNTPPTATAQRFLREGPGGKEAAESLQRILAAAPSPEAGADAARRYVMADLAKTVGANGKVSETSLRRWINSRTGMLSQMPELDAEVQQLLGNVTGRSAKANAMRDELERTVAARKRTENEINQSTLSILIDADPRRAAAQVLASRDPVAAVRELKKAFAGNVPAEKGWRAAVADHLVESLSTGSKAGIADEADALSLQKLSTVFKKNEPALREIFGDDVQYLQQARRRLELLSNKGVPAATNSSVPQTGLLNALQKPVEIVARMAYGALKGGSVTRKYNLMAEQLPDTAAAASQLLKRAMFDPEVAKHLLMRDVEEIGSPRWNKKLNRLMGWTVAGQYAGQDEQPAETRNR